MELDSFEPEFASVADYARAYRQLGLQAVPSMPPRAGEQWKRPAVPWKPLEHALIDDGGFGRFFSADGAWSWLDKDGGRHPTPNIGLITGDCSGRVVVLDLDLQKELGSQQWWIGLLAVHNNDMELETPTQRTGGGGLQMLLRWPLGRTMPTAHKTPIGVDIRGQGAFAVLPPSRHESGQGYRWLPALAPWEVDVVDCPIWLCEAIEALLAKYGRQGTQAAAEPGSNVTVLPLPQGKTHTLAGEALDGREGHMTSLVWAALVDLRRAHPFLPSAGALQQEMEHAYRRYESGVSARDKSTPKHIALDREGRGVSAFRQKWDYALQQWDGKLAADAQRLPAHRQPPPTARRIETRTEIGEFGEEMVVRFDADTGEIVDDDAPQAHGEERSEFDVDRPRILELWDGEALLRAPNPEWLVDGLIIKNGLGFLYGDPGCGKSFLALDLALTLANGGERWIGKPVAGRGGVLYLAGEGKAGAKLRYMAWQAAKGVPDHQAHFLMAFESLNFMKVEDVETLERTIEHIIAQRGETPCLIVVDTVSRVLPGAKENLQEDMSIFVQACDRVRQRFGCAVMGVHHSAKGSGQMRGSTVLKGAADFAFAMTKLGADEEGDAPQGETPQVIFIAEKIKDAVDSWTLKLDLVEQACGDLAGSSSLVVQLAKEEQADFVNPRDVDHLGLTKDDYQRILKTVRDAAREGRPLNYTPKAESGEGRGWRKTLLQRHQIMGATADAVRDMWLASGVITHFNYVAKESERAPGYPEHWSNGHMSGYAVTGDIGDPAEKYRIEREAQQHTDRLSGTDDTPF